VTAALNKVSESDRVTIGGAIAKDVGAVIANYDAIERGSMNIDKHSPDARCLLGLNQTKSK